MEPERAGAAPRIFEDLAFLFRPSDPSISSVVLAAGSDWGLPDWRAHRADVLIWGRAPFHDRPSAAVARSALLREVAVATLLVGPAHGFASRHVFRLPPARRASWVRRQLRYLIQSGLVAVLARGNAPARVIDAVAAEAAGRPQPIRMRPSGDGSVLARVLLDGGEAELRVARAGGLKDPRRALPALLSLEASRTPLTPRLLGSGSTAGALWTTESVLPGSLPPKLTPRLVESVIDFLGRVPRAGPGASSTLENLSAVGHQFPGHADAIGRAGAFVEAFASHLPSVLVHGDLWLGNLLVDDGALTGVIDWDASYPAGLPATDLLNLLAMNERRHSRQGLGRQWTRSFWTDSRVVAALDRYWVALGIGRPGPEAMTAIAIDWWAGQIVAALRRGRQPASDPAWVDENVERVIARMSELVRGESRT